MTALYHQQHRSGQRRVGKPVAAANAAHISVAHDKAQSRPHVRLASFRRHSRAGRCFDIPPVRLGGGFDLRHFSHSITTRPCSLAGDRRVGGYDLPATRPVVKFSRRLSTARRALFLDVAHQVRQDRRYVPHHHSERPSKRLVADDQQHDGKGLAVGQVIFGEKQNAFG